MVVVAFHIQYSSYDWYLFNLFCTGFQLSFHTYFSESQPPVYAMDHNNTITGKEFSWANLKTDTQTFTHTCFFYIYLHLQIRNYKQLYLLPYSGIRVAGHHREQ